MATTLTEYFTQRVDSLTAHRSAASADLSGARADLASHEEQLGFWLKRVEGVELDTKRARAGLDAAQTPADMEAVAETLRQLRIERRASLARVAGLELSVKEKEAAVQSLAGSLDRAGRRLEAARDDLARATARDDRYQSWFSALAAEPLASITTAAGDVRDTEVADALDSLNDETSAEFMERVVLRADNHWERVDDLAARSHSMASAWDPNTVARHGHEGNVEIKSQRLEAAAGALESFVANAAATVDNARALAAAMLDEPLLSAGQKARFDELSAAGDVVADLLQPETDFLRAEHDLILRRRELEAARATVKAGDPDIPAADVDNHPDVRAILDGTDGRDAIGDMETAFDDASNALGKTAYENMLDSEKALEDAQKDLERETKAFLEENPGANPETESSLDDERAAVAARQGELDSARDALRATAWYRLEELEAAIPDPAWRDITGLLKARRSLDRLRSTVPDDMRNELIDAEDELVTALRERHDNDDGFDVLNATIGAFRSTSELIAARGPQMELGVVRGLD